MASPAKVEDVWKFGAHEVFDHVNTSFEEGLDQVDLVFDTVGGELLERAQAVVRKGGRLVSLAGEPPDSAAEDCITAVYLVVEPNRGQLVELARLVDRAERRSSIDSVFPLAEARAAFERVVAPGNRGKVVLRVADD